MGQSLEFQVAIQLQKAMPKEYEIEGRLTDVARLQNDYTCFAEGTSFV